MVGAWNSIRIDLEPRDLERLADGLASEGFPVRVEGHCLVFSDPLLADAVRAWYTKLTLYNRLIHRAARIRGKPITIASPGMK